MIPLQDGVGTSFSAASVIPTGALHLVSTARGHVSKAQTVVSGTQYLKRWCSCYPRCVLISGGGGVGCRRNGRRFWTFGAALSCTWQLKSWQRCSPTPAALICTVTFAIPAMVKSSLTGSPVLQHTHFFPKVWLKIRAAWL